MPLSEESDPSGKRRKTALNRGDNSSRKGRDDRRTTRRRPRPFSFFPARPGSPMPRRPAAASARRAPPARPAHARPAAYHASPARHAYPMPAYSSRPPRPTAPPTHCQPCSSQRRPPPCRACPMTTPRPACFGRIAGPLAPPACRIAAALALPGPPRRLLQ